MFTGLIQDIGSVLALARKGAEAEIRISTSLGKMDLGESVCVKGACLSVTSAADDSFSVFCSGETLERTGLAELKTGSRVNLERALRVGDRIGGHLVTGHVDARVRLLDRTSAGEAERFGIEMPSEGSLQNEVASKGSIAVDGVSLTVNAVRVDRFEVAVIPITLNNTTLGSSRSGDMMNVETDVLAKYVARQIGGNGKGSAGVDMDLLVRSGFVR